MTINLNTTLRTTSKLKIYDLQKKKNTIKKAKRESTELKNIFKIIYLIRDLYPGYKEPL